MGGGEDIITGQRNKTRSPGHHTEASLNLSPCCERQHVSHSCPQTPLSQAATKPFAMLRHDFAADPRLSDADVRVLTALMYWARDKPDCWPSLESIGRRVHKKERAVRTALESLEHYGYIRFQADPGNKTGRKIVLVWQAEGEVGETQEGDSPRKRDRDRMARAKLRNFATKGEPVSSCEATLDPQQAHVHPSDIEITLLPTLDAERADDDSISEDRKRTRVMVLLPTLEEQQGKAQAVAVDRAAHLISGLLLDEHSLDFHRSVCWRVAKGKIASQVVVAAFVATYDKVVEHSIDSLGPYFVGCLRNMIGDQAIDEFLVEFKEDRERAKREYACRDVNLMGEVA